MSALNELKEALEQLQTAQFVTTMLRDISATRLQSIRTAFEANKTYYEELHGLMAVVKTYASQHAPQLLEATPERRVYVALTSNKRFYGTLNHDVMRRLATLREADPAASGLILGQTGRAIYEAQELTHPSTFQSFVRDEPTPQEMIACIQSLKGYTEVVMVHPTFINSFTQRAAVTDVSHVPATSPVHTRVPEYLFEPDIPEMLAFFTTQIRLVLFERVLLETRLALTGARLMKMQRARERAGELVTEQRRTIYKETSTVKSMRLLETFTGFQKHDL